MGEANEFQELHSCRGGGTWAEPPPPFPAGAALGSSIPPSSVLKLQGFPTTGANVQKCRRLSPPPPSVPPPRSFFWGGAGGIGWGSRV